MFDNDPEGLRLVAGMYLNKYLISKEEAEGDQVPDLITVIDFNEEATVDYELGDPSQAADDAIKQLSSVGGGTFIGGGVKKAVEELSKSGSGGTSGRSGIIILTDGVDDPSDGTPKTVDEIMAAANQGIRVSMGYMKIKDPEGALPPDQDERITNAIEATGGQPISFDDTRSASNFIIAVARNGLTNSEKNNQGDLVDLVPTLTVSQQLKSDGPSSYRYTIFANEEITLTVTALEKFAALKVVLREASGSTDIKSVETNSEGIATLEYKSYKEADIVFQVSSADANAKGVFTIGLKSDIN
ncbi:hypothetical protein K458DRAFT_350934, partial [Lentithecium fluviatile CBS 122367]